MRRPDALTSDTALPGLARLAGALAGTPCAAVNLIRDGQLVTAATLGGGEGGTIAPDLPCGDVLRTGRPVVVVDAATTPRGTLLLEQGVRSYVGVPVPDPLDGRVLGTLCATGLEPRAFGPVVVDHLQVLAVAAATHVALARAAGRLESELAQQEGLVAELESRSRTDALTGAGNRRAFDEALSREVERTRRTGRPLSLLMVDLDHFKAFNDSHGHLAGDDLLRRCAHAWQEVLRPSDLLCRYGGEEFAVLAADCGAAAAFRLAERLRALTPAGVTVSAGVATCTAGERPLDLLGRADRALYAAKGAGRDRSVAALVPERAAAPAIQRA